MKNILARGWEKIKWPLFLLIWSAGIIGYLYFYQEFQAIRIQADQTWENHIERIEIKSDAVPVQESPKTVSEVAPNEGKEEVKISSRPSGIADILPKIHILESSGGKNDSCKKIGKVNGYGFMQSTFRWKCFDTKEEVEKEVAKWFEKNLQNKTLAESLCYYNRGIVTEDCEYAKKFASLKI